MSGVRRHVEREARSFGRGVGVVLLIAGAYFAWRGRAGAMAPVLATAGVLLVSLGQFVPRTLALPAAMWMRLAHGLGWVSTRLILGLLFFLVVTPIGAVRRMRGFDPLDRRGPPRDSYWTPYPPRQHDPRYYERMF